ncbi:hypothetical protein Aasi_1578 [Candidatus Amoebophilus asiaticus 5a2]|uniref:Uncharacterized protein n=2 Tax=Candidatus Amoebophilus asiaticus TaxID=281120 RepID=C3L4I8_AMOA5|nr:hypothetical protein Aasi_1578 [Candidatus Amoebophilus asiaticus 5a2]
MSCQNTPLGLPSSNQAINKNEYQQEHHLIEDNVTVPQTPRSPHFVLTAANRQIVDFSYEQGTWQASLSLTEIFLEKDNLIKVPVYYESGYTLEKVAACRVAKQRKLVHIIPSKVNSKQPGYVYIGRKKDQHSLSYESNSATMQNVSQPLLLENTHPFDLPQSNNLEYSQTQAIVDEPGVMTNNAYMPISLGVSTAESKHKRNNMAAQSRASFTVRQQHTLRQRTKKAASKCNQAEGVIQMEPIKLGEVLVDKDLTDTAMPKLPVSFIGNMSLNS